MRDFPTEIAACGTLDALEALRLEMRAVFGVGATPGDLQIAWKERRESLKQPPIVAANEPPARVSRFEEYRKLPAMNFSTLKHGAKSMLALKYAIDNPDAAGADTTSRMVLRAIHALMLEPDTFDRDFVIWEGSDRRGSKWTEFKAEHANRTIIKLSEREAALGIRDAIAAHPVASELLRGAKTEHTIRWTDPVTGIDCKGRLDGVSSLILDLKGGGVDEFAFMAHVKRNLWHAQLAWYQWGWELNTGAQLPTAFITYTVKAPYDVIVIDCGEDWLEIGRSVNRRLLDEYDECRKSGIWPGRSSGRMTLPEPPAWLLDEYTDEETEPADQEVL